MVAFEGGKVGAKEGSFEVDEGSINIEGEGEGNEKVGKRDGDSWTVGFVEGKRVVVNEGEFEGAK